MIKKVYLSGLGAIGSIFAGKLHDTNPEVLKVIADRKRMERYTKNQIKVNDTYYNFNYILPDANDEKADLILIAVKQHHLEQSLKNIKKFVGENTLIISLLNGIDSEIMLENEFGREKILYAFCVGQDALREGTHITYNHIGKIIFNDPYNPNSLKVQKVSRLFEKCHIPYETPDNILREQWWKFMLNVGVNQVSSVLKAPYGVFQNSKEAMDLVLMAAQEVVLISKKAGISLDEEDLERLVTTLHNLAPHGKTSMLQDMEAGRKTEVDIFAGSVIRLGQKYGVEMPVNQVLYKQIQVLENQND